MSYLNSDTTLSKTTSLLNKRFEGYVGVTMLIVYSAVILVNILLRTFTEQSLIWSQDVVLGLFIWMSWLGVAYVIHQGNHIRFGLVVEDLSPRATYVVYWLEWVSWLLLAGLVVVFSLEVTQNYMSAGAVISGTPIPQHLLYASIPVGFSLILLRVVQQMVTVTLRYRAGEEISIGTNFGGEM
ncbi:TRAP transporter small permease [Halobellus sp. H-GB7]|uniref:TRAP transporter small permease n=1 Tax=Halobellus sp. H-GB7 TaxID=3069756 RepID=UPI0027B52A6C|nr:TRAP transporter small permease [Halobellus sp. H-GB7]MDQ2055970.1 TRAP transporter small permease [Halobellus sp. H-GB7]